MILRILAFAYRDWLFVFALLSAFSVYAFHFYLPGWTATAVLLSGIFLNALLMGGLVGVLVLQYGQKAEISAWTFAYLFILIAGIYYPVSALPTFFYRLALFIPLTYFLDYFRFFYGHSAELAHPLIKGYVSVAIALCGIFALLNWSLNRARRSGILLKLSE